ncbi:uncharacterized protein LOC143289599 [Babylonia areolata]|uniref:uncharacterized protein LOC143289599 n=1 Tax=Babylonia areolata TaxID=304850 RepID=UPI003FD1415B
MFSCCVRHPRSPDAEDAADRDCRWRKGENYNRAFSQGDKHGSEDFPPPGHQPPVVFFIDSGESTNPDSPVHGGHARHLHHPRSRVSDGAAGDTMLMTSGARLDPNSRLQRTSRLHNEKLPSFSALDRTKRPRMRREDAITEGDSSSLVVYEPLTFETFRSSSPPLAVIAPLAKAKVHPHGNPSLGQKETHSPRDHHTPQLKQADWEADQKASDSALQARLTLEKVSNIPPENSSPPLPKVTHPISISKDGAVNFRCKGLVNRGFSPDERLSDSERNGFSTEEGEEEEEEGDSKSFAEPSGGVPKTARRPTTLPLPNLGRHSPLSFTSSAASVFTEESSFVESAVDSDTLSQTQTHKQLADNAEESGALHSEHHSDSRSLQVPDSLPCRKPRVLDDYNRTARDDANSAEPYDRSQVTTRGTKKQTSLEPIPETSPMRQKIPPKKPKRKNPPSNASTATSRDAISLCLTSEEAHGVTSSDPESHGDVELRHDGDDVLDVVLTPPEPFKDQDYAGFDSFDEFNGSLV